MSARWSRGEWGVLAAAIVVVALLRLPVLTYGLPWFEGADDAFILEPSVRLADGAAIPTSFGLPDSTLFASTAISLRIAHAFLSATSVTDASSVAEAYEQLNEPWVQTTARLLQIGWSTGLLLAAYALARRIAGKRTAIITLLLLTVSHTLIEHTIQIRPDIASACIALLAVIMALRISDHPGRRTMVLAGIVFGLAVATKYPLVLLIIPLGIAYVTAMRREHRFMLRSRSLWIALGASVVVFSVVTPGFWPLLGNVAHDIAHEARSAHTGLAHLSFAGNLWFYLRTVLQHGIGTLVAFAAIVGIALSWNRSRVRTMIVWSFPIALVVALSFHGLHWERWMIPVLPFLAIAAALTIDTLQSRSRMLGAITLVLLVVAPFLRTVRTESAFLSDETRTEAATWIRDTLPAETVIAREVYTPDLRTLEVNEVVLPSLGEKRWEDLQSDGVEYLVSNRGQRERYLASEDTFTVHKEYYQSVLDRSELLQTFSVDPDTETLNERPDWDIVAQASDLTGQFGPTIEIYRFLGE